MVGGPAPMMRVAFFGSGSPMSTRALDAVAARVDVVAVVVPAARRAGGPRAWRRRLTRWRARRPLAQQARALGLPVLTFAPGEDEPLAARLASLRPELTCVATFPSLLPPSILTLASAGAIGLHPSLLPRRRGPDPLFWTYFDGDAETGVTVLRLDQGEDTGPIVSQAVVPVPRGRAGRDLYEEIARHGAALLAQAVADAAAGRLNGRSQDEAQATRQPLPTPQTCAVELRDCGAEWLWHFLAGLGPHRPFVRVNGAPLLHGAVRGYALEPLRPPGIVERSRRGWRLHCRDGYVDVGRPAPWRALRARLARPAP